MSSKSFFDPKEIKKIEEEYQKKIEKTMGRIERRIKDRMDVLKSHMLRDYYGGYIPSMYVRSYQLHKAFGPYTKNGVDGDFITMTFGLSDLEEHGFGVGQMNHKLQTINITYKRKKGGTWYKEYTFLNEDADEVQIFENFQDGYHPNVGFMNTEPDIWERASKLIDKFVEEELDSIIAQEIAKIQ